MANYTAQDVKRLRELTGAGMLDCKNALADNDGVFDKAVEQLRIKGAKDVGKRASRSTAEGLVAAKDGVLIELNSETDFVAKNQEFQDLAAAIAQAASAEKATTVEELNKAPLAQGTVDDAVQALAAKIGEKIQLRKVVNYPGQVAVYLHKRSADLPPAVGVIVEYTGSGDAAAEAARGAAMQIAALKAKYLSREDVPQDIVETERRIAEQTAKEAGKPEQALPKIIEGRLTGFFKDVVLVDQPSVVDSKKTVGALLKDAGVTVTRFARFEVGQE